MPEPRALHGGRFAPEDAADVLADAAGRLLFLLTEFKCMLFQLVLEGNVQIRAENITENLLTFLGVCQQQAAKIPL